MNIREKALAAQRLRDDETFQDVIAAIRDKQVRVFLNDRSQQEEREQAHVLIRALAAIEIELKARVDAGLVDAKKGQHRGSD